MEQDNEQKGIGNSYDFGARMYDCRLARWQAVDPLAAKYPSLSPYNYVANSPIIFVDPDGKDFGIKINHTSRTIIIVANIYTTSEISKNQAEEGAKQWNQIIDREIDGWKISFEVNVIPPKQVSQKSILAVDEKAITNGKINKNRYKAAEIEAQNRSTEYSAALDPIGNAFQGKNGKHSRNINETLDGTFPGGNTANNFIISMHSVLGFGDMGNYPDLVSHEIRHLFGLNDFEKGIYFTSGGIMEYPKRFNSQFKLLKISDNDIRNILSYAREQLQMKSNKVNLLENEGSCNCSNPVNVSY